MRLPSREEVKRYNRRYRGRKQNKSPVTGPVIGGVITLLSLAGILAALNHREIPREPGEFGYLSPTTYSDQEAIITAVESDENQKKLERYRQVKAELD